MWTSLIRFRLCIRWCAASSTPSDRSAPGPGVLIVHHHFGVTGNMKVNVCNFAKLGYSTFVPDLYKMLGESDGVHEAQKKTSDGQFTEILNRAWHYLTTRPEVDSK